jgi:predicted MFS family arabinose efflux permease
VGSLAANRWLNAASDSPWRRPERILPLATLLGVCGGPVVFLAPTRPPALAATAVTGLTMGVATVATVGLLVRRYAALRGPVMGLNLTGMNLGTFAGATLASIGLALGDYAGLALTLLLGAASTATAAWAVRAGQKG